LVQAPYETIGVASSGHVCIVEVKQSREMILSRQRALLESLCTVAPRCPATVANDSVRDEQILALP
jgi:hypothetical protein